MLINNKIFEEADIIIECDGFIIPNQVSSISNKIFLREDDSYIDSFRKFCDINKVEYDDITAIPQVNLWFTNNEIDNIARHNFIIDGIKFSNSYMNNVELIPLPMVKEINEGETMSFLYQYDEPGNEHLVKFVCTAAQTKYRYRRFGTFEEVLKKILWFLDSYWKSK